MTEGPLAGGYNEEDYWAGTYLDAAYLIPSGARMWPRILEAWAKAGFLASGVADLVDVHPSEATSRGMLGAQSLPEISWTNSPERLLQASRESFVSRLGMSLQADGPLYELRIEPFINDDDTLTVYVAVPFDVAYTQHAGEDRQRNLRFFLEIACRMFTPEWCLIGAINEELYIDGLEEARQYPADLADWALYGTWMTTSLMGELGDQWVGVQQQAKAWQPLGDGGVFVRWTDLESVSWAPPEWIEAVAAALRSFPSPGSIPQ